MSKRILILDDDTDLLEVLSLLLSDAGYDVQTLQSGERVFEVISEFHPDLVLMDIMLDGMDGRLICSKIKMESDFRELPVILISGTHGLAEYSYHPGAPNDYLAKPFEMDFLLDKIGHYVA